MPYLYLVITVICASTASIMGAFFNSKTQGKEDTSKLYNLIYGVSVLLGWSILFIIAPSFDVRVIPYSIGFGVCYIICEFGFVNALRTGSVSLTTLILNLALIATTVWGFFFWDTEFTWLVGIGLVLVIIAIWLCLYAGKEKGETKITLKWLIYSLMAFGGNAGCAIIQRSQQIAFNNKHGNMLMLGGVFMASIFFLVMYLRSNKKDSLFILKKATPFPIIAGMGNLLLNVLIIVLARYPVETPPSIIYPSIAIGSPKRTGALCAPVLCDSYPKSPPPARSKESERFSKSAHEAKKAKNPRNSRKVLRAVERSETLIPVRVTKKTTSKACRFLFFYSLLHNINPPTQKPKALIGGYLF